MRTQIPTKESWKTVPSAPFYEASTLGRIRRLKSASGTSVKRICKPYLSKVGYPLLHLSQNNNSVRKCVHRLVVETFLGPCPDGQEVNHRDGNKENNRIENLGYVTRSENHKHAIKIGLRTPFFLPGELHPRSKLKTKQIKRIRELNGKMPQSNIAKEFGITQQTVSKIVCRQRWDSI